MSRRGPRAAALRRAGSAEATVLFGTTYPMILRGQPVGRLILAIGLGLVLYPVVTLVVGLSILTLGYLVEQPEMTFDAYRVAAVQAQTPVGLLAQSLSIAALLGLCWVLMQGLFGLRLGWLSSVRPGLRWRYLLLCVAAAAVTLYGLVAVTVLLGLQTLQWRPQPGAWAFIVVVLLATPVQAAAEEYLFRGFLLQTVTGLIGQPWIGAGLSAVVFAFLHGGQNLPLFLDRLAFGLLAAWLVVATGGLEAAIATHVVNNVGSYLLAAFTASVAEIRAVRELGWTDALLDIGGFAAAAAIAVLIARRLRLPRAAVPWSDAPNGSSTHGSGGNRR